jgi:phosphohistidine phosphatase
MKQLILIRHAKSSWAEVGQADIKRPLNERGMRDAPNMALRLSKLTTPDGFLVSTAVRTQQTMELFRPFFPNSKVMHEASIYEASVPHLLDAVCSLPKEWNTAALVGHNPGMSSLVAYFTGQYVDMPTCAVACVELNIETWEEASEKLGELVAFDYPKNPLA